MHWMILPFKRYADFQGRSRRMEYWMFTLLNVIVAVVLAGPFYFTAISAGMMDPMAGDAAFESAFSGAGGLSMAGLGIYGIYFLIAFIPSIAVVVRRLHDRDMSGWWYLGFIVASFIPIIGLIAGIALFVLMVLPGTDGPNRFGPDPKNPTNADVFE